MRMGRPRKRDKHLPRRMYFRHGAHWFVGPDGKWTRLHEEYGVSLRRYAALVEETPPDSLKALIERYRADVLPACAPETRKGRELQFKAILRVFGQVDPRDIRAPDGWKFLAARGRGQRALHEIRALSAVLSHGVKLGALDANPLIGPRWGEGIEKPRRRYVTDEEFQAVRAVAPPMVRYAMNIALITAARQADILGMTRAQLTGDEWKVRTSKTGKPINFPLAGSLKENVDAALVKAIRALVR